VTCSIIDLLQGVNRVQRLTGQEEVPIARQFILMQRVPVKHRCQCSSGKPPLNNPAADFYGNLVFAVLRMEMCRRMVR
jgi:hypothetical protein